MRDGLMQLLLEHGDKPFFYTLRIQFVQLVMDGYITATPDARYGTYKITPKGLEYLKNA